MIVKIIVFRQKLSLSLSLSLTHTQTPIAVTFVTITSHFVKLTYNYICVGEVDPYSNYMVQ